MPSKPLAAAAVALVVMAAGAGAQPAPQVSPSNEIIARLEGRWTNELQSFFAKETGETAPPTALIAIAGPDGAVTIATMQADGRAAPAALYRIRPNGLGLSLETDGTACAYTVVQTDQGFVAESTAPCAKGPSRLSLSTDGASLTIDRPGASLIKLRRARPFVCWTAVLRGAKHGDTGEGARPEDWDFRRGLWLHDQGGRATVTTDETPARAIELRMRRVEWPSGPNRPSLTLYVHAAGSDRALSYAWGEENAERLGINLRWIQVSCTYTPGAEPGASPTAPAPSSR